MNKLEQLRKDMLRAALRRDAVECPNEAPWRGEARALAVLDEFIAAHEVVELGEHRHLDEMGGGYYADSRDPTYKKLHTWQGRRVRTFDAILPRTQEHKPTDAERLAHLEDEVHERCGSLGRRVNLLEYRTGAKVGGRPVASPLLEAAEVALKVLDAVADAWGPPIAWEPERDALRKAIKEERERNE